MYHIPPQRDENLFEIKVEKFQKLFQLRPILRKSPNQITDLHLMNIKKGQWVFGGWDQIENLCLPYHGHLIILNFI